jgi:hypothetical protein
MKFVVWIVSAVNLYFGLRCFLNAIHVLHTSKYSQATTVMFAALFLGFGAAGLFLSIVRDEQHLALLIGGGPWVLGFVILFISMVTGRQQ